MKIELKKQQEPNGSTFYWTEVDGQLQIGSGTYKHDEAITMYHTIMDKLKANKEAFSGQTILSDEV